jgi:hypothetical protein
MTVRAVTPPADAAMATMSKGELVLVRRSKFVHVIMLWID